MNGLPAEILLEIGETGLETYKGMLAIPKFARAVTIGYRLNVMLRYGYNYKAPLLIIHRPKYNMFTNTEMETRQIKKHEFVRGISNNSNGYVLIIDHSAHNYYDSYHGISKNLSRKYYDDGSIDDPIRPLFMSNTGTNLFS